MICALYEVVERKPVLLVLHKSQDYVTDLRKAMVKKNPKRRTLMEVAN